MQQAVSQARRGCWGLHPGLKAQSHVTRALGEPALMGPRGHGAPPIQLYIQMGERDGEGAWSSGSANGCGQADSPSDLMGPMYR